MNSNKLTIVLPTYNRSHNACKRLEDLINDGIHLSNKIIVVNDGSSDDTYNKLEEFKDIQNVAILHNPNNLGYAKNLMFCINQCETEYVLFMTDDENYYHEYFLEIEEQICNANPMIDFMSCSWESPSSTRNFRKLAKIDCFGIWKSAKHASGLIYNARSLKKYFKKLEEALEDSCLVAHFFPQIFLLHHVYANGGALYVCPIKIGGNDEAITTNINDHSGNNYKSIYNAFHRHISFQNFYKCLADEYQESKFKYLRKIHKLTLYNQVLIGLEQDFPLIKDDMYLSSYLSNLNPKFLFKYLLRVVVIKMKFLYLKITSNLNRS